MRRICTNYKKIRKSIKSTECPAYRKREFSCPVTDVQLQGIGGLPMKEVRVCEAMKSPVVTLSDGTVLHQQDGGAKSRQVPIWEKSNLTLEEAAAYSGIGINKLRTLSDGEHCQFVL